MALTPNPVLGALVGDDSAELIALTPGQLASFPLGVIALGGNDTVIGATDSELISGNQGADQLSGGVGSDTLVGGTENDLLDGQADNDFLLGDSGADLLRGGRGDDQLFGGADNNDILFGDAGNDLLDGGLGIDVVTGGEGIDIFVLARRGADVDFFTDFEDGIDLMQLPTGITFNDLQILPRNSNETVISFAGEEIAVLDDIVPSAITLADFVGGEGGNSGGNDGSNDGGSEPIARDSGVIVRLDQQFLYDPKFDSTVRIMPLGDSITRGQVGTSVPEEVEEGYRLGLFNRLTDFGLSVDFVGSQSSGSENLFDKDHQGHPGFTSRQLTRGQGDEPGVDGWIPAANPEVILLMAGTNNSNNTADQMIQDLDSLIDRIFNQNGFTGELLVSTIPPFNSESRLSERVPNIEAYNAQIPTVINNYLQQGKTITFVDMFNSPNGLTADDITPPPDDRNGIHPTVIGYDKIAQFWFNELLGRLGSAEPLSDVNNATGTDFNDVLVGSSTNNTIEGRRGNDVVTGGGGADLFSYATPDAGVDIISDFDATQGDAIGIAVANFGGGLVAGTSLSITASPTGTLVASGAPTPLGNNANFLYNTLSGELSFDVDGAGAQPSVQLAILTGAPQLSVSQFLIA
ncbi:GDSL-type esterase/lipase family protein [Lyngbya sp. PCC 8106]|uniref:GDSL-type esterase/lipase family protein n=1 Tax=Lyngbya sp. (strain PCC 8106) TaxID=313612 RepID=UPI0000EAC2F9|nr:GDSL-type esterase/lipase family protein [Lyngbya sp. PCC 8106]EAW38598.1 hypothetical protein L8106_07344 [Lyngbya sp. PCC 8106]